MLEIGGTLQSFNPLWNSSTVMVHIHALAVHAHGPKLSMRLGGRGPHCFESWLGVEMHHA